MLKDERTTDAPRSSLLQESLKHLSSLGRATAESCSAAADAVAADARHVLREEGNAQGGCADAKGAGVADATPMTRRQLFKVVPGAAAVAAVGAAVAATGCSSGSNDSGAAPEVLKVADDSVVTLDSFRQVKKETTYCAAEEILTLDCGAQFFSSGSSVAAALCTADTSSPLSTIGLMNLSTGAFQTVLDTPEGASEGFNFYEVTCSDELIVWVESNYLTGAWRVYNAPVDASTMSVGKATLLEEGDNGYDAPEIAAVGAQAYWIVQPAEGGVHAKEDSLLKTNGGVAFTSHGRFNGKLSTSGNAVVCMPRADSKSSVYYQLTAIQNGNVIASQVLPHGYRPSTATYINGMFSFGIGAGYDYGDGIANVGTYIALSDGAWLRLTRTPVTPAGTCNGWLFCKSSGRTVFIDPQKRRYFTVAPPSGSEDYGDYSVSTGEVSDAVYTYATVTQVTKNTTARKVVVRRLKLTSIA